MLNKILLCFRTMMKNRREREENAMKKYIEDNISVVLKKDSLFITVNGQAVYKADKTDTSEDIVTKVNELLKIALNYQEN